MTAKMIQIVNAKMQECDKNSDFSSGDYDRLLNLRDYLEYREMRNV